MTAPRRLLVLLLLALPACDDVTTETRSATLFSVVGTDAACPAPADAARSFQGGTYRVDEHETCHIDEVRDVRFVGEQPSAPVEPVGASDVPPPPTEKRCAYDLTETVTCTRSSE